MNFILPNELFLLRFILGDLVFAFEFVLLTFDFRKKNGRLIVTIGKNVTPHGASSYEELKSDLTAKLYQFKGILFCPMNFFCFDLVLKISCSRLICFRYFWL
ncbi:unnamed protein product [Blepharisma stoltei]|uniref:Uncharacterized protein n=1 Tax=Blepharisma stoltei TaxID=1481888 RepID=A0AAU9J583_9CILI|nr:unnamed protein product [Blepharisma stoltei]